MLRTRVFTLSVALILSILAVSKADVDVVELTAQELAVGYRQNQFTTVEVVQAYLDRIEAFEHNYNAFTTTATDALSIAAAIDKERLASGPRGPLHGVPIVIKESIDVTGLPSTAGLPALSSQVGGVDLIPSMDAPVVARLRDAGAIILGKTNIPGFSLGGTRTTDTFISNWDGQTYNSYDRSIAPGASSAGTATAVSASFGAFGLGEETSGSIQNPSGAQSLVGVKPTFGLVPNTGVVPIGGSTRDVVGPMARTVYDAAIALDVVAGPSEDDAKTTVANGHLPEGGYTSLLSTSALEGKRIGTYGSGWSLIQPSASTKALYDQALNTLVAQGATIVDDPFSESNFRSLAVDIDGFGDVRGYESIVYDVEQYLDRLLTPEDGMGLGRLQELTGLDLFGGPLSVFPNTLSIAEQSLNDPDALPDLSAFIAVRDEYRQVFSDVLETFELDALVYPQMLRPTPGVRTTEGISRAAHDSFSILGTPGVTVPAGYYEDGSPFSLLFMGDVFSEANLLALAYDYEQATLHRVAPQLLHAADADEDGEVGFSDFLILGENFGRRRFDQKNGDFNQDRIVDFADFLFLSKHFGHGAQQPASVPEPNASMLLSIAVVGIQITRKRRSSSGDSWSRWTSMEFQR